MFLKVIHLPYHQVGTNILVEDENHHSMLLSLYNYVRDDEDPEDVFQVGIHLALLAPYMKKLTR